MQNLQRGTRAGDFSASGAIIFYVNKMKNEQAAIHDSPTKPKQKQ